MSLDTGAPRGSAGRSLYRRAAIASALIVLLGFGRTYYLKGAFGTPALPGLVHLHGIVMTLWIALFIVQAQLVAARRVDLHRRLGVAGTVLAVLVVVVGAATAIEGARRGVTPGPPPLVFMAIPLGVVVVFAVLVGCALALRRRGDYHKRLMLLASLTVLTPAIARIPLGFIQAGGPLVAFALTDLLVFACVGYDTAKNRRLHPAFGWGVLFFLLSQPARFAIASSPAWMEVARRLVA
jgi:hypothetical protein